MKKSMNCASPTKTKVLRLRLKDKHAKLLCDLAREVNFVWNYCNELQITMFNRERRAAKNILAAGRRRLVEGIPAL